MSCTELGSVWHTQPLFLCLPGKVTSWVRKVWGQPGPPSSSLHAGCLSKLESSVSYDHLSMEYRVVLPLQSLRCGRNKTNSVKILPVLWSIAKPQETSSQGILGFWLFETFQSYTTHSSIKNKELGRCPVHQSTCIQVWGSEFKTPGPK